MKALDSLYCARLSTPERRLLADRVHARRRTEVRELAGAALTAEGLAGLGAGAGRVVGFLRALLSLSTQEPEAFRRIADHWSTAFLLRQLVRRDAGELDPERAADSLASALLFERLFEGSSSGAVRSGEVRVGADGWVDGIAREHRLRVAGAAGQDAAWLCDDGRVVVTAAGRRLEIEVPVAGGGEDLAAVPRVAPFDVRVVDGPALGLRPRSSAPPAGDDPQPIARTLAAAYGLLDRLWPEVLPWASVLVPAFIDLGAPPGREFHTSGSCGPGHPIWMTRVWDPFLHAEDVVHEVQHGRLYLLAPAGAFPSWTDARERFASPYRPDPRPLRGLLLGLHAFLAVNRLRLGAHAAGLRRADARALFNSHRANLFVFRTLLEHERVPREGRRLFAQMAGEIAAQHREVRALAPTEFVESFEDAFTAHLEAVRRRAAGTLLNLSPEHRDWEGTARLAAGCAVASREREEAHAR